MSKKFPNWLCFAVFYEIYPQSFYDSNGDGIGDIPGIIEKLDYIQSLGCNAIWLNPCYESPFQDAGYDVSDYYKIATRYGKNSDLKRLFKLADKRGIKICLDLLAGHTSIEHPWFKASAEPEKNKYSDYYIWSEDWTEKPEPPLMPVMGYSKRNGHFVSNFFWFQPALNYGFAKPDPQKPWQLSPDHSTCKAVRRNLIDIMRFWLDMGASGFRVDMADSIIKNDKGHEKTSVFWRQIRELFDKEYPDAALISEWFDPPTSISAGFHCDFMPFGAYNPLFRMEKGTNVSPGVGGHSYFRESGKGDITAFLKNFNKPYQKTKNRGVITFHTGNHDLPRISIGRSQKELELVFVFNMTMPGVPFVYYGDEIGMKYFKNLPSKEGGYTRTGARTPMQWDTSKNAGFSSAPAEKLYLPIDPAENYPNVQNQHDRPNSLLNKVKKMIDLRRSSPELSAWSDFTVLYAKPGEYPFVYARGRGKSKFLIALNPSGKPVIAEFDIPKINCQPQLLDGKSVEFTCNKQKCKIKMAPISYAIYKT